MEKYRTIEPYVLPKQLLSLGFSVHSLTGLGCLLLTSVFCEHSLVYHVETFHKQQRKVATHAKLNTQIILKHYTMK